MRSEFLTNYGEEKFIDRIRKNLDLCDAFYFSVSFIKKPGLRLLAPNIEAAISRGATGKIITSTYQNFTDIESLQFFFRLQNEYPERFQCHLEKESFPDISGTTIGFHSKGYLFDFANRREVLIGSSNITVFALLKNIEWDICLTEGMEGLTYQAAMHEFDQLWERTPSLQQELIEDYRTRLYYSIERWDVTIQNPRYGSTISALPEKAAFSASNTPI